jgi:hypothetical protein
MKTKTKMATPWEGEGKEDPFSASMVSMRTIEMVMDALAVVDQQLRSD